MSPVRLDLSAHLPPPLAALSNKWRCKKKWTNRVQIWFSSIGNRAFSVQWVIARGPLPFDVRRRNDTNCISPQWNTISGWRDGEHIHLLVWSFKRRAPILIWRDSSASSVIKNQKGEKHRQRRRSLWLKVAWFTDSLIPSRRGWTQEIRLRKRNICIFNCDIQPGVSDWAQLLLSVCLDLFGES